MAPRRRNQGQRNGRNANNAINVNDANNVNDINHVNNANNGMPRDPSPRSESPQPSENDKHTSHPDIEEKELATDAAEEIPPPPAREPTALETIQRLFPIQHRFPRNMEELRMDVSQGMAALQYIPFIIKLLFSTGKNQPLDPHNPNPVHLALARGGYRLQTRLRIPDRYCFFSPSPGRGETDVVRREFEGRVVADALGSWLAFMAFMVVLVVILCVALDIMAGTGYWSFHLGMTIIAMLAMCGWVHHVYMARKEGRRWLRRQRMVHHVLAARRDAERVG